MTMREQMESLRDSVPKQEYLRALHAVANCPSLGQSLGISQQPGPCGGRELYECFTNEGMPTRRSVTTTYDCLRCQCAKLGLT